MLPHIYKFHDDRESLFLSLTVPNAVPGTEQVLSKYLNGCPLDRCSNPLTP